MKIGGFYYLSVLSMATAFTAPSSSRISRVFPTSSSSSFLSAKAAGDTIEFAKYEGLGNDFILIDDRDKSSPSLTPEQSERWENVCGHEFSSWVSWKKSRRFIFHEHSNYFFSSTMLNYLSLSLSNLFRLCNRNFGVGGDGVIFALKAPDGEIHSNIFALIPHLKLLSIK